MARRKLEERQVRKILKLGNSKAITLPSEELRKLGWRAKQKVTVKRVGKKLIIEDWK